MWGETLTAKEDGESMWLQCDKHTLLGAYYQQVPEHIVELKKIYAEVPALHIQPSEKESSS